MALTSTLSRFPESNFAATSVPSRQLSSSNAEHERLVPFLYKLAEILEDPTCTPFIHWSSDGTTVLVSDPVECSRIVLPKYFKHNTFASFVRQLNIYGFHKTVQDAEWCEFKHNLFQRNRPDLLREIKRKANSLVVSKANTSDLLATRSETEAVVKEVLLLKQRQDSMEMTMRSMQRENEALWKELAEARQHQQRLTQKVSKVVYFLMNSFEKNEASRSNKRRVTEDPRFPTSRLQECREDSPTPEDALLDSPQPILNPKWMGLLSQLDSSSQKVPKTTNNATPTDLVRSGDLQQQNPAIAHNLPPPCAVDFPASLSKFQTSSQTALPSPSPLALPSVPPVNFSGSGESFNNFGNADFGSPLFEQNDRQDNDQLRSLMFDQDKCFARLDGLESQLSSFYES